MSVSCVFFCISAAASHHTSQTSQTADMEAGGTKPETSSGNKNEKPFKKGKRWKKEKKNAKTENEKWNSEKMQKKTDKT